MIGEGVGREGGEGGGVGLVEVWEVRMVGVWGRRPLQLKATCHSKRPGLEILGLDGSRISSYSMVVNGTHMYEAVANFWRGQAILPDSFLPCIQHGPDEETSVTCYVADQERYET